MIKHTIRKTNNFEESGSKPGLEFYLDTSADGEVQLVGKDSGGVNWYIAAIANNGTLIRYADIPGGLGLEVKDNGQIKLHNAPSTI